MSESSAKLTTYREAYYRLKIKKSFFGDDAMKAVEGNGDALQYVQKQTDEICLKAVERNGYALRYVQKQTDEICLKAVERNGDALQYVEERMFAECKATELHSQSAT
jgi:hypothetical protein